MRIKITKGGCYGAEGEMKLGSVHEFDSEPQGWAGRFEVLDRPTKEKSEFIVNPAKPFNADKDGEIALREYLAEKGVTVPDGATVKDLRALAKA